MIVAGTYPFIHIDLGSDEPVMKMQHRDIERGYIVWRDFLVDGELVYAALTVPKSKKRSVIWDYPAPDTAKESIMHSRMLAGRFWPLVPIRETAGRPSALWRRAAI